MVRRARRMHNPAFKAKVALAGRGSESADFGLQGRAGTAAPVRGGFRFADCPMQEAVSLPGSCLSGLKWAEAE
jgi:hypothetical protein